MSLVQVFQDWCKQTHRSGGVLIGSSIKELLQYLEQNIETQGENSTKLLNHVNNDPIVLAAITESVHRFYMDKVLSKNEEEQKEAQAISDTLSRLWNMNPNWRHILQQRAKRYTPDSVNANAVAVCGRPDNTTPIKVKIDII